MPLTIVARLLTGGSIRPHRPMRRTLGFLHTDDADVDRFHDLAAEIAPELVAVHRVEPELNGARHATPADAAAIGPKTLIALRLLATRADVIVCTCPTLGTTADELSDELLIPVLSAIGRPSAENARAVVATAASIAAAGGAYAAGDVS